MDRRIEELRSWGCEIDITMERMLDDEEFYLECLESVVDDQNFSGLSEALEKQDAPAAFDCAHALKGILSNVGVTPMYDKAVEILEPLRTGKTEGLAEKSVELLKMKDKLAEILNT